MSGPPPPLPPPYPSGTPEYDAWAAEDEGPTILILCWFFVALATIFVLGRLYARISLFRQLKSDDYWCLASIIFAYVASAFTTVAVGYGHGQHVQTLTQYQAEQVRLWTFAAFMPGVLVLGLPKVAVVTLLNRLLNPSKWHRRYLWAMVSWCLLSNVATVGTLSGQCTPTRAMWNFDMVPDCIDPDIIIGFSIYSGTFNAFVDLYLAIYPAIVLFKLQLRLRKKIVLSGALGIGAVGSVVAIYKTTRLPDGLRSQDFSYDSADIVYWSIIEASTTIIAATIPTLSPLMDKLFKGRNPFRSLKGSKGTSKGTSQSSSKHRQSYTKHMYGNQADPFASRRKTQDPENLSLELQDAVAGDSSDNIVLPIQKQPGGRESLHTYGSPQPWPIDSPQPWPSDSPQTYIHHQPPPVIMRTNEVSVSYDPPHHPPQPPQNAHHGNNPWPYK